MSGRGKVVPFIHPQRLATIMGDPAAVGRPAPFDPAARGYSMRYRVGQATVPHCPGCGRQQWLVGRLAAECAFCATALPLDQSPG